MIMVNSELPHFRQGNLTIDASSTGVILDAFDCSESNCDAGPIVADLTVNFGQDDTTLEIRTNDGQEGTA